MTTNFRSGDYLGRKPEVAGMKVGAAALVMLLERYRQALLDPFATVPDAHRLMYFLEAAGEPLQLSFREQPYRPYAWDLHETLYAGEGRLWSGYGDGSNEGVRQLEILPGAVGEAGAFLAKAPDTRARLARVFDLMCGFESAFGLELLTTVHWTATDETECITRDEVVQNIGLEQRDRASEVSDETEVQFSSQQIILAFNVLQDKQWIEEASRALQLTRM